LGNTPGANITKGIAYDSPFQQMQSKPSQKDKDNINICYMVDSYKGENGITKIVSRTLLDIDSSQFSYERTKNKLVYFNIILIFMRFIDNWPLPGLRRIRPFDEAKLIYDDMYKGASSEVKKIEKETRDGSDYEGLVK